MDPRCVRVSLHRADGDRLEADLCHGTRGDHRQRDQQNGEEQANRGEYDDREGNDVATDQRLDEVNEERRGEDESDDVCGLVE